MVGGSVNVSYHGTTTLVSYMTTLTTGKLTYSNETSTQLTLTTLVDIKGSHDAFEAPALKPGVIDSYISYLDNGATPKFVVASVTTNGTPALTSQITGLVSPPSSVELGPDGNIWFAYETDAGFGYASTSPTALTKFVEDMTDLRVVNADSALDSTALWGVIVENDTGDHYACRLPVTQGASTAPAGCWMATNAPGANLLWHGVDDRGVLYLVSTEGSPVEMTLFQSVTAPTLTPDQIP
ncbi:MAG: hypothetical protein U1F43_24635 [Myxococcota bacterium]